MLSLNATLLKIQQLNRESNTAAIYGIKMSENIIDLTITANKAIMVSLLLHTDMYTISW